MIYSYRSLTKAEFNQVKVEIEKVTTQHVSFAFNHGNGIRISATKRDGYAWTIENAEAILITLESMGMFTLPIRCEFDNSKALGFVHSQIFSMIHKALPVPLGDKAC